MRRMISVSLILALPPRCLSCRYRTAWPMGRETAGIMTITAGAAPVWSMIMGLRRQGPMITAAHQRLRQCPGYHR